MKRIICIAAIVAFATPATMAQTIKKTKEFITASDWAKAKESAEATLANPKLKKDEQVEAWYLKAKVYSGLASNPATKGSDPAPLRTTALDAIKKAVELGKDQAQVFLTMDQYAPVFNLYTVSFEEGAALYNEAKYAEAFSTFRNTAVTGEYIFSQGWGLYKLDTTLTYYSALSAINAKNEPEAVKYFSILGDAKVANGPEHATIYRYLAKYYFDKKDEANMFKYLNLGKQLFPKDDYLPLLELDYVRDKGDKKALYAKYEEIAASSPENFDVLVDYANELFGETHVSDIKSKPANYAENCKKIEQLYTQALKVKPENSDVQLALGKHFYNMALLKDEEARLIKGAKPEDVKKKADIKAEVTTLANSSIAPLEVVFNAFDSQAKLKTHDRSNYKSAANLLQFAYDMKGDKAKSEFYQKKYDEADKKQ